MAFTLHIKPKALKNINKLQEKYRQRALQILDVTQSDPFSGKKLYGKRKEQYSLRVWPYRVVYKIYKSRRLVIVVEFNHRGEVCK